MNKISKVEFIKRIQSIDSATSVKGMKYTSIQVYHNRCTGIRESTNKPFEINLDHLYNAYVSLDGITTTSLREYVARVQSPSLAILREIGLT